MKPLTISCLSEYRKGVFGAVFWLLIDVVFLLLVIALGVGTVFVDIYFPVFMFGM